ncbi:L,D-transpeptidase [Halothermothrix orenii]|uniref:ErfK/YbiS/YcfS/YnhG family protein n=1 Tax=Halothermothrix orenii (strain H 168 / OCM 544 / DSM 9562) TaxID=373903 RepID=B8D0E7_HALOH|nr:L,D-transpeptidase [Halothermothrix orenii]ACL70883.1 ErfK/YbiS/YcfS/YnhG family protein [Halothermothrix orenii H 168]
MAYQIYIELNTRRLILKNNGSIIATYPVAIGKPSTPTPVGDFKVLNKIKNPGGVLGTRWLQFTWQQHGIHGTNKPWLIGQAVSNGCVRMYNRDVEELYDYVSVGTPVIIRKNFSFISPPGTGNSREHSNTNRSYFIYTVKRGDSLWKIAHRYNVTVDRLKKYNNLNNNLIYPGQKLKIPVR